MTANKLSSLASADIRRLVASGEMPPPVSEFRACWACSGTKVSNADGLPCRMCDYRGDMEYEVRR